MCYTNIHVGKTSMYILKEGGEEEEEKENNWGRGA